MANGRNGAYEILPEGNDVELVPVSEYVAETNEEETLAETHQHAAESHGSHY